MLKRLRVDKQFNILSYGKGGLHGTGGNLVSDFNPIAVMHVSKIDKVKKDNKDVNRRFAQAFR